MTSKSVKMEGRQNQDIHESSIQQSQSIHDGDSRSVNCDKFGLSSFNSISLPESTEKLSAACNHIRDLSSVSALRNLTVLNLSNNNICEMRGLRHLTKLVWLNLSANKISVIENLSHNLNLHHIDLSDNDIVHFGDIRGLTKLKVLLLHGNKLESLTIAKIMLPRSLNTLSLASNSISDLNEVSNLSHLVKLEQLSIMNNPCCLLNSQCDYRPFVINWCTKVRILDGCEVSRREGLKAEWLFSQGKGRRFNLGQHHQLVQYLSAVCPVDYNAESERDEQLRLSRVSKKQHQHQQQQRNDNDLSGSSQDLLPNQQVSSLVTSANSVRKISTSSMSNAAEDVEVKDVSSDDESPGMLESESRYLPVLTDAVPACTDNNLPINLHIGGVSSQSAVGGIDVVREHLKSKKIASQQGSGKPAMRRIAANFNKSSGDSSSAVDTTAKPADGSKTYSAQHETAANIFSGQIDSRKQIYVPSDNARLLAAQTSAPVDIVKGSPSANDSKTGLAISPSKLRNKSQSRIDSNPLNLSGESRRLLKGVIKKSPGRRDEPGVLLATSSSLYTPEKYRNTMRQIYGDSSNDEDKLLKQEPNNEPRQQRTSSTVDSFEQHRAATIIQALWRGYCARQKNAHIQAARHELRSRRLEDHLRFLRLELDRHSQQTEQERRLRAMHVEALKHLYTEVRSLQEWKDTLVSSQDPDASCSLLSALSQTHDSCKTTSTHIESTRQLIDVLERSCAYRDQSLYPLHAAYSPQLPQATHVFQFPSARGSAEQRELGLETVCQSLQKQLTDLREVVASGLVVCGNSVSASRILANSQQLLPTAHSLQVLKLSSSQAIIKWKWNSDVEDGPSSHRHLLGFRVFIDDAPVTMVGCSYKSAVINELVPNHTYSFSVQAVYTLGESLKSEIVSLHIDEHTPSLPEVNRLHVTDDSLFNDSSDSSDAAVFKTLNEVDKVQNKSSNNLMSSTIQQPADEISYDDGASHSVIIRKLSDSQSRSCAREKEELGVTNKVTENNDLEEEIRLVPKPPADVSLPRRNSLTRRGSVRHRHYSGSSGSSVAVPSGEEQEIPLSSVESRHPTTVEHCAGSSPNNTRLMATPPAEGSGNVVSLCKDDGLRKTDVGDETLFCVGEMRSRSKELKSRDRTERRSSSLGANLKQPSDHKTNQQPQRQRPAMSALATSSSPSTHREFFPSSEKVEQTGAGTYKLKKIIGHKRSKSDLPDKVVDSSASRQDPPVPTPASSPRLHRSSSFSVGRGSIETSPLRQAVSMDMLKEFNKRRSHGDVHADSNDVPSADGQTQVSATSDSDGAANDSQKALGKQRRQLQIGNKAANLFANLQKRISTTNTKL